MQKRNLVILFVSCLTVALQASLIKASIETTQKSLSYADLTHVAACYTEDELTALDDYIARCEALAVSEREYRKLATKLGAAGVSGGTFIQRHVNFLIPLALLAGFIFGVTYDDRDR